MFKHEYALKVGNQRFQLGRPVAQANKHVLRGEFRLLAPEPFTYQTPRTIAIHGARQYTFGYD